jgi:N-methylhydantoinase A/oxoprolinase/acetone carboxylase beta subunit
LSTILDFTIRATTAVLNARIIPRLGRLIVNLENALKRKGIFAPIVVVKGDGTLMRAEMAKQRPVETIFSGPAASVAGARHLTGLEDALVVDVGGTTTDTAAVENGRVRVCSTGSTVAGRRTHVRALDIRTAGLGGDSLINREKGKFSIGPAGWHPSPGWAPMLTVPLRPSITWAPACAVLKPPPATCRSWPSPERRTGFSPRNGADGSVTAREKTAFHP